MESADVYSLMQILAIVVSIVVGIAGQSWLIVSYLMRRQDNGDEKLHERVSQLRADSVSRVEYEKDAARFDNRMVEITHAVERQGHTTTTRLDTLIAHFVKRDTK